MRKIFLVLALAVLTGSAVSANYPAQPMMPSPACTTSANCPRDVKLKMVSAGVNPDRYFELFSKVRSGAISEPEVNEFVQLGTKFAKAMGVSTEVDLAPEPIY